MTSRYQPGMMLRLDTDVASGTYAAARWWELNIDDWHYVDFNKDEFNKILILEDLGDNLARHDCDESYYIIAQFGGVFYRADAAAYRKRNEYLRGGFFYEVNHNVAVFAYPALNLLPM